MKSRLIADDNRKRATDSTTPDRFVRPRTTPMDAEIAHHKLLGNLTMTNQTPFQENLCDAIFDMSLSDLERHPVIPYAPFQPTHYIPTPIPTMTMKHERTLEGNFLDDFYTTPITWSKDNLVYTVYENGLYSWDPKTFKITHPFEGQSPIIAITTNDQAIAFAEKANTVHIHDLPSQSPMSIFKLSAPTFFMVPYNFGGFLAPTYDIQHQTPDALYHLDLRQEKPNTLKAIPTENRVVGMAVNPRNTMMLAIAQSVGQVDLFDIRNLKRPIKQLKTQPNSRVKAIAFNPETPSEIATGGGSSDNDIIISDITTGRPKCRVYIGSQVTSLHYMSRDTLFFTGGFNQHPIGCLRRKSSNLMVETQAEPPQKRTLWSAKAPDEDNTFVVASADNGVRFFNVNHNLPKSQKKINRQFTIR